MTRNGSVVLNDACDTSHARNLMTSDVPSLKCRKEPRVSRGDTRAKGLLGAVAVGIVYRYVSVQTPAPSAGSPAETIAVAADTTDPIGVLRKALWTGKHEEVVGVLVSSLSRRLAPPLFYRSFAFRIPGVAGRHPGYGTDLNLPLVDAPGQFRGIRRGQVHCGAVWIELDCGVGPVDPASPPRP